MKVINLNYLGYVQHDTFHDNFDVQILLSENTGKKRGFGYVKVPKHMSDEFLKLHEIEFEGKMLVVEKAKTSPKAKSINELIKIYVHRDSLYN